MSHTASQPLDNTVRTRVVLGACLTQFTIIGLLFAYGLFFKQFEDAYGWSRTALSASTSIAFFLMGVLAIPIGRLNDQFGPRLVLGVCGILYGIGYALLSQASEVWHLFVLLASFVFYSAALVEVAIRT